MFGKWDVISHDYLACPSCLWHDSGYMLIRCPIAGGHAVTGWILVQRFPHKILTSLPGEKMEFPLKPPINWADAFLAHPEKFSGTESVPDLRAF